MPENKRLSSFELLRVIAMFLVISAHTNPHLLSPIYGNMLYSYGLAGLFWADLYFMISGFFMITKNGFSYKKVYSLFITIYTCAFFSLLVFMVLKFSGAADFSNFTMNNYLGLFVRYFAAPVTSNNFWFITAYVFLFILIPILNPLLNRLNRTGLIIFCLLMLAVYSISNSFNFKYAQIERAVFDYALGGFFKLYVKPSDKKVRHNLILIPVSIILVVITAMENIHFDNYSSEKMIFHVAEKFLLNGILFNICAVCIFSVFLNLNFSNSIINKLSAATFSIYLLHANEMTGHLWHIFLKAPDIQSRNFIPTALFNTSVIYAICALVYFIAIEKTIKLIKPFTDYCYEKLRQMLLKREIKQTGEIEKK